MNRCPWETARTNFYGIFIKRSAKRHRCEVGCDFEQAENASYVTSSKLPSNFSLINWIFSLISSSSNFFPCNNSNGLTNRHAIIVIALSRITFSLSGFSRRFYGDSIVSLLNSPPSSLLLVKMPQSFESLFLFESQQEFQRDVEWVCT